MEHTQRLCPITRTPLESIEAGGVRIDYSPVSGGIWFDNYELQKFDEPHEELPESLLNLVPSEQNLPQPAQYQCPVDGTPMQRHVFSYKKAVEIDECPLCGGIWLDWGELQAIRELYPDAGAKQAMADEMVESILQSDPNVQQIQSAGRERVQRAHRVANMFRFICPSRYTGR